MNKQKKILIVEDEAINAMFLKILLESKGYKTTGTVATGKDAIANVAENCPDLILLDITLNDSLDGIETANILRENSSIPIIFISGYDDNYTINRIKTISNSWKLIKPIDEIKLTNLITDIFTNSADTIE